MEQYYEGHLHINPDDGVIFFMSKEGHRILRVTHLPTPIPDHMAIDLVAISNVTSYTPLQAGELSRPSVRYTYVGARTARGWGSAPAEVPGEKRRNGFQMRPLRREA